MQYANAKEQTVYKKVQAARGRNTSIQFSEIKFDLYKFSGDFVDRVTPVPIPNTEVKPVGADDTASFRCGKVGSRRINIKKPVQK